MHGKSYILFHRLPQNAIFGVNVEAFYACSSEFKKQAPNSRTRQSIFKRPVHACCLSFKKQLSIIFLCTNLIKVLHYK